MWLGEDVCFSNAAAKGVTGNVTSAVEANSESANASWNETPRNCA